MGNMVKTVGWLLVFVLIVWGGVVIIGENSKGKGEEVKEPIRVGFVGPLSGDRATLGQNAKAAVELAVKEVNKAGGVNGRNLEVVYEDGKCAGADALGATTKLIITDKVSAIVGGLCSEETSAIAGAAEAAKVAVVSYCASDPAVSNAGDYTFRTYPGSVFHGAFAAKHSLNDMKKKKVAVLYEESAWGTEVKNSFVNAFKELGGTIVAEERYGKTDADLSGPVKNVKAAKPELLYFVGYGENVLNGLKQVREDKLNIPVLGADLWEDPVFWRSAGESGNGVHYVTTAPAAAGFAEKFRAIGRDVTSCAAEAYDAAKLVAEGLKEGVSGDSVKVRLYATRDYAGASGVIGFDQNGDLVNAVYVVKEVRDGKAEVLVTDAAMEKKDDGAMMENEN